MKTLPLALAIAGVLTVPSLLANEPTNIELLEQLKKQQKQIEALIKKVEENEKSVKETDEKVEASASAIEESITNGSASKTSIGGYGELHYNNIEDTKSVDFHRFVTFLGHEFTDTIRFFSELEVEHSLAGDGKPGEVEVEQAYVEIDISDSTRIKSGLFLLPVGIINETHEPPTFYGVERNPIEKNIIPATWWEAGAGFNHQFSDGLVADFAIHSGLNVPTDGSKAFLIREGRQKVAKAKADNLAYTARIKYTAIPGLELSASYQVQTDVTQGELGADANLLTAHVIYNSNGFGMRALYATWDISGVEASVEGRDQQKGYYLEPSYKLTEKFGLFARYNVWDNSAGGLLSSEQKQTNIGVNYWPHANVVFKFDFEERSGEQDVADFDGNGFNLGVGYQF